MASLAIRFEHSCAIRTDGALWCGGNGTLAQIGDGKRQHPVLGDDRFGQLGDGITNPRGPRAVKLTCP